MMNIKIFAVFYLFLASEATLVMSLADKYHNLTDLDQKGILRDQMILELDSSLNGPTNMCQLCTKEMADDCFPLGDYHDFHVNKWVVSIYTPKNASENVCYFDLFRPQVHGKIQKEFLQKERERFYLTDGCEEGCVTKNNDFKISKQTPKYHYEITRQNKSGEYV